MDLITSRNKAWTSSVISIVLEAGQEKITIALDSLSMTLYRSGHVTNFAGF